MIPLMTRTAIAPFTLPNSVAGGKPTHGRALVYWITPGFGEALGLRLREGRFFVDSDARAGRLATMVNQEKRATPTSCQALPARRKFTART